MSKKGPLIIVDDDQKEQVIYRTIFTETGIRNKVLFFDNGLEALEYLETTKEDPFLIICDIKMPKMDGMDLCRKIAANPYLKKKATPFIFRSGSATPADVNEAFELSVQGLFTKTDDREKMKQQIQTILDYWLDCLEPTVIELKSPHANPQFQMK